MPKETDWSRRRRADPYYRQAKQDGFASRAAYKLQQLDQKFGLLRGRRGWVLDLCCAPGSWSEYVRKSNPVLKVIGADLQHVKNGPNFIFIKKDIMDDDFFNVVEQASGQAGFFLDVVLSDCAPKFSGAKSVDLFRQFELASRAIQCCQRLLKPGGACVVKAFQGLPEELREIEVSLRAIFDVMKRAKPDSSQDRSPEFYYVGLGKKEPDESTLVQPL